MSAHTPGPLKVVNGGLSQLAIVAKDGNAVAFVPRGHSDADANSNLFAAAPDLLAALKDVVKYAREDRAQTPGFTRLARALVRADAALASAEGRS